MHLYHLTIQKPTAITMAISGSFSAPKAQEILVARGKVLELYHQDKNFRLQLVYSVEAYGLIRCIMPFRLTGSHRDYIVVGSDSGRIVILEYDAKKNRFNKIHQETFGKTGCRRIVPGQYLATDPKGRAVMIAAVEKQKFVYVLNRDSSNRLTISSPLEAHKSHNVLYSVVGVDVGFDNPIFAAIEVDHSEADTTPTEDITELYKKTLTYYELDLGLNHVVKKWSSEIDKTSHYLISVPGGNDGPSGVLVCSENFITYKNQGHADVVAPIPLRFRNDGNYKRGTLVTASAVIKTKKMSFFLIQTECGDIFKVTLDFNKQERVLKGIKVQYFDTVPVARSICLLMKTGFMFVASEFGSHRFYKFEGIGDENENVIVGKTTFGGKEIPLFNPRPLKNLKLADSLDSLSPIIDFKVADLLNEGTPQLYTFCGRGPNSSLRILRHGLALTELAKSPLRGSPTGVFTVKQSRGDMFDKYIIVSFTNHTMVLSIGETVEQISDSGFIGNAQTLSAALLGDDSLVQVYPGGIRHIHGIKTGEKKISEWNHKKTIVKAAVNESQVVIALAGGEIVYFELNTSGQLVEIDKKDMGQDVACLAIGNVPEGRLRCRFLAVGTYDKTVRVLSLDPEDCLNVLTRQALPAEPESLSIIEMGVMGQQIERNAFYLNIGLNTGILLRSVLDNVTGELSDTRTRFLGTRGVRLVNVKVQGNNAVLALSSRSWLCYNYQHKFHMTPLSYDAFDYSTSFSSVQCPEGFVSLTGNLLKILAIEKLGEVFNQYVEPLKYTPRKFCIQPKTKHIIFIEADNAAYNETEKEEIKKMTPPQEEDEMEVEGEVKQDGVRQPDLDEREFGTIKPPPNSAKWASYIRIYDPVKRQFTENIELDNNEAAVSLTTCHFKKREGQLFLVVGTVKDMQFIPRKHSGGFIRVYKFSDDGQKLELVHITPVDEVPLALHAFQGRLLAGIGRILRLYDIGKKRLLRKCENKNFPQYINYIVVQGSRIYVGDMNESFHFVKYKRSDNILSIFADCTTPRWLTAAEPLDYNTMAGADKFGNIFVSRLPPDTTEEVDEDTTGTRWIWERGLLNGAQQKAQEIVQFYVGDTVTGLQKASIIPGSSGVLMYSTIMGAIGVLIPFTTKDDVEFFSMLEMHMRQEDLSLVGREHLSFRSYYFPVKSVIDGDLCELYGSLDVEKQKRIADELERASTEVEKKLEDIRNQSGF